MNTLRSATVALSVFLSSFFSSAGYSVRFDPDEVVGFYKLADDGLQKNCPFIESDLIKVGRDEDLQGAIRIEKKTADGWVYLFDRNLIQTPNKSFSAVSPIRMGPILVYVIHHSWINDDSLFYSIAINSQSVATAIPARTYTEIQKLSSIDEETLRYQFFDESELMVQCTFIRDRSHS